MFLFTLAEYLVLETKYYKPKTNRTMKKEVKKCYVAPTVESLELAVEQGFAGSGFGEDNQAGGSLIEDEWKNY